jgi:heat shock protein HtpX
VDFYARQRRNRRNTLLFIGGFVVLFVALGFAIDVEFAGYLVGGSRAPYVTGLTLAVATGLAALSYYKGDGLVLLSLLAEPLQADDPEHRQLHNIASEMALAAGLPLPRLFVIPDPAPNAMATGRHPAHAAIAVTAGALQLLDREETQGVVAHEMAHIANRDTLVMTVVAILLGGLIMLADWGRRSLYFARHGRRRTNPMATFLVLLLIALAPLLSRLLALAVSRQREYLADASAVEFTRNPEGLARALEKIAGAASPLRGATRGTAHLFISDPLRRRSDDRETRWAEWFSTHPPIARRVALLRGLHAAG